MIQKLKYLPENQIGSFCILQPPVNHRTIFQPTDPYRARSERCLAWSPTILLCLLPFASDFDVQLRIMHTGAYSSSSNVGVGLAYAFAVLGTSIGISTFFLLTPSTAPLLSGSLSPPLRVPLVRAYAARNIGSGVGLAALLLSGQRKSAAILLVSGIVVMVLDSWLVAQVKGGFKEESLGHLFFVPISLLTSWLLTR